MLKKLRGRLACPDGMTLMNLLFFLTARWGGQLLAVNACLCWMAYPVLAVNGSDRCAVGIVYILLMAFDSVVIFVNIFSMAALPKAMG